MPYDKIDYALMPYFGGVANDTNPHSAPDSKPMWLKQSVENIRQYAKHIEIGVCNDTDHEIAVMAGADGVSTLKDINPLHLPAMFMRHMQPHTSGFVMFVEADNALHFKKTSLEEHLLTIDVDHGRYVTPWVWNRTDQKSICRHGAFASPHPDTGELWHISNTIPETLKHRDEFRLKTGAGDYYVVPDTLGWASIVESGGCTYIMHNDLFQKIKYMNWQTDPLEYSAIIEVFWAGTCLKTYFFNDFMREHFSGGPEHVARCQPSPINPQNTIKE